MNKQEQHIYAYDQSFVLTGISYQHSKSRSLRYLQEDCLAGVYCQDEHPTDEICLFKDQVNIVEPIPTSDSNDMSESASGGGQYEKPIGGPCYVKGKLLTGCQCKTDDVVFYADIFGEVNGAVCANKCQNVSSCPELPTKTVKCQPYPACFIQCVSDKDCPAGGYCQDDNPTGRICMFKNQ
ncbi:hypothetical protein Pmar_PMAR009407 [Perkinsus marinus ATCC 50983]|uniref:Uncharacterized protein n=1 Tax=Perkinsus marinus (strain ATCC 50983 / TXsc) TaxID=423536 RepID=C5KL05_PERM5|nr:hypothetical protein Pmar_PMAR009407 [Perkinsus marinus ATCC 50983]EER14813.1 hypothetical protein Pmar_PMAR009407 [Perkinsus marinus ATCC 50983]|eukprot:XP_002783017.1 hypothetical protein Pmar_PMAR009407 [Perkinsus marinus ATCC 50983]